MHFTLVTRILPPYLIVFLWVLWFDKNLIFPEQILEKFFYTPFYNIPGGVVTTQVWVVQIFLFFFVCESPPH